MALSSSNSRPSKGADVLNTQIADAVQLYAGSLGGLRGPGHATTQGYLDTFDNEAGMVPLGGFIHHQELGDTSASPPTRAAVTLCPGLYELAVTGAASRADIGKAVYATDDDTFTLTRPANGRALGVVLDWRTSTSCQVYLFGAQGLAPYTTTEIVSLGKIDFATTADGDIRTSFPMPYSGKVLAFFGMVDAPCVGASGSILLNLEIGTTNVTGGVITYATGATTATLGQYLAGTTITAENQFSEGSLLSIEGSSAAATRTSGTLDLFIKVERTPQL
jgi:hypothetical protein